MYFVICNIYQKLIGIVASLILTPGKVLLMERALEEKVILAEILTIPCGWKPN